MTTNRVHEECPYCECETEVRVDSATLLAPGLNQEAHTLGWELRDARMVGHEMLFECQLLIANEVRRVVSIPIELWDAEKFAEIVARFRWELFK